MDYKDLQAGHSKSHFYFRAKMNCLKVLLNKNYKKGERLNILSIGAGTGDEISILKDFGSIFVVDVNKKALDLIDEATCIEKKLANACSLPYSDNQFDLVVCLDVLEHIEKDNLASSEIYRVLKFNGLLFFSVPAFQFLFSSHDRALDHFRRYSKKQINNLLGQFSLRVSYWNSLLFFPIAILRLIKKNSPAEIDNVKLPKYLNYFLYKLISFDNFLIKHNFIMPFGVSLIGVGCKKKN